jgi:hypothetical protein
VEDEMQGSDRENEGVERDDPGRTPGGAEPLTGERADDESQNADIPAAT